jgi:hypothetical protein
MDNHTNGDVPYGMLYSLYILNPLITVRRMFGEELKLRKMMKNKKEF